MNTDTISSSLTDATTETDLLLQKLEGYCSFKLSTISGHANVEASTEHDLVGADIELALSGWSSLLKSEAGEIKTTATVFDELDRMGAQNLLGIPGGL